MAIAEAILAEKFNTDQHTIVDHHTYAIAGDGCMMEGVTSEASSLAGHLGLGKLIVFYDSNKITIEGSTDLAFTEDVAGRYQAYGWHVQKGDAYDLGSLLQMVEKAKAEKEKPSLIIVTSVIAKGSPNMAGHHDAHGAALGDEEVAATKKNLGLPSDKFFTVLPEAVNYYAGKSGEWAERQKDWESRFQAWTKANPELAREWDLWTKGPAVSLGDLPTFEQGSSVATRNANGVVLNALAEVAPNLIGGSADLAGSNKSDVKNGGDLLKNNYTGRNMHFGVREHAMGSILNGMSLHGGLRPYGATFLVFADYMRPAMRLAAMMKLPVVYILTHDSIYVGEDGPTHQPVEHAASLRIIPGLVTLRPADARETALAWKMAMDRTDGPTAMALTRQNLPVFERPQGWESDAEKGAYTVLESDGEPKLVVIATGSEVSLALDAVKETGRGNVRVISMISRELYLSQPEAWRTGLIPDHARRLVVEVGVSVGWEGIAGQDGGLVTLDRFGESGPAGEVSKHLGFTTANVASEINRLLG
jgi:transketolase